MPSPYQVTLARPGLACPALSPSVLFTSQLKLQSFLQGLWQTNPAEDLCGGCAATVTSQSSLAQFLRKVHTMFTCTGVNLYKQKEKQNQ